MYPHSEVPATGPWTYGGHVFGLEPLILPSPGEPLTDSPGAELTLWPAPAPQGIDVLDADAERIAWFRWITGHQVSFVLWRLLDAEVTAVVGGALPDLNDIESLPVGAWERYVDGYSAMLLYAGSCSRGMYHRLIRPSMRLQHPSFSGSWSPDCARVRRLFHDTRVLRQDGTAARLAVAVEAIHRVHLRVAERLVPEGPSLLRESPVKRQDWGDTAFLYDNYFLTRRRSVERRQAVGQLLRRLGAISDDLAVHGLYPADTGRAEAADPVVRSIENRVAELARGLIEAMSADATFTYTA